MFYRPSSGWFTTFQGRDASGSPGLVGAERDSPAHSHADANPQVIADADAAAHVCAPAYTTALAMAAAITDSCTDHYACQ